MYFDISFQTKQEIFPKPSKTCTMNFREQHICRKKKEYTNHIISDVLYLIHIYQKKLEGTFREGKHSMGMSTNFASNIKQI